MVTNKRRDTHKLYKRKIEILKRYFDTKKQRVTHLLIKYENHYTGEIKESIIMIELLIVLSREVEFSYRDSNCYSCVYDSKEPEETHALSLIKLSIELDLPFTDLKDDYYLKGRIYETEETKRYDILTPKCINDFKVNWHTRDNRNTIKVQGNKKDYTLELWVNVVSWNSIVYSDKDTEDEAILTIIRGIESSVQEFKKIATKKEESTYNSEIVLNNV